METTWGLLKQELSHYNIDLIDAETCKVMKEDLSVSEISISKLISSISSQYKSNLDVLYTLWSGTADLVADSGENVADETQCDLFISSLKDLTRFARVFEQIYNSHIYQALESALDRDSQSFPPNVIKKLPDMRISIDFTHTLILRQRYIMKLLTIISNGEEEINRHSVKTAQYSSSGVQGPWGNLDLPMRERVFPFSEINEEMRGRDKAIRSQPRYRMGLENYNNDRFGEGFVWREQQNEPYLWEDNKTESPYSPTKYRTMAA